MSVKIRSLVKGFLLVGLLCGHVFAIASDRTAPRVQTVGQEVGALAQANELTNSAVKLYNAGKYKDALGPAKQALEIREKILPADDKRVYASVGNLAAIHLALKNYKEAEVLYKHLLAADEKRSGPDSLQVAKTLDVLAWLRYAKGNVSQAEADYKRVIAIREKITGPDGTELAQTLFRLAEIYQSRGELEKAVPLYQRLLKFNDKVLLGANMTVGDARHSFACLLRKMKKPDEAAEVLQRVQDNSIGQQGGDKAPSVGETPPMGGVLNGKAVRLPKPEYPAQARAAGVSGTVVVQVTISEEGRVVRACAVHGHEFFWQVSERAAYAAEFAPTELLGKPVKVTGIITYNFIRQ